MRSFSLVLLALVSFPLAAEAGDWNQWRGPGRNGLAVDSPPLLAAVPDEGILPVWKSEEIPSGFSGGWASPIVANGKLYQFVHTRNKSQRGDPPKRKFPWLPPEKRDMTDEEYRQYEINRRDEDEMLAKFYDFRERVYCLDAATGKTLWNNDRQSIYTRFLQSGSPAVVENRLYILCPGRKVRCIDATTGKDVWETRLGGDFRDEYMMSSIAVADGVAAVLAGHLVAFDATTGKLLWEGDPQATSGTHSSPAVWSHAGREYFVVNVSGSKTACFEPQTGKVLWTVDSQANYSTPVVVGDLLLTYGNSRKKGLRCFRMSTGGAEQLWVFQKAADKGSSPVVVGEHVYVQGERRLACVELASGKTAWSTLLDLGSPQYTSLAAADGKVFYAYGGVLMFAADSNDFRALLAGKFDATGLLATEAMHRQRLGLAAIEREPGGQEKAEKIYNNKIAGNGPTRCTSPALAGGRLYLRFKNHVACYDLRAGTAAQ